MIAVYDWTIKNMLLNTPNEITLFNTPNKILGAGSSIIISSESFFMDSYNYTYYFTILDKETYHPHGNDSKCISFLEREVETLDQINPSLIHPWFQEVESEIIIHSELSSTRTSIFNLLDNPADGSTITLIKTDKNNNKHLLIITTNNLVPASVGYENYRMAFCSINAN